MPLNYVDPELVETTDFRLGALSAFPPLTLKQIADCLRRLNRPCFCVDEWKLAKEIGRSEAYAQGVGFARWFASARRDPGVELIPGPPVFEGRYVVQICFPSGRMRFKVVTTVELTEEESIDGRGGLYAYEIPGDECRVDSMNIVAHLRIRAPRSGETELLMDAIKGEQK